MLTPDVTRAHFVAGDIGVCAAPGDESIHREHIAAAFLQQTLARTLIYAIRRDIHFA